MTATPNSPLARVGGRGAGGESETLRPETNFTQRRRMRAIRYHITASKD
jgi:hypothetical protein